MTKHSIRFKTVDPIRGQVTKVETVFGELGSGIFDINDREIFEGDVVRYADRDYPVEFTGGTFTVDGVTLARFESLEIVG